MKILLVFILLMNSALAIDVRVIKKGQQAPEDGFFVTAKTMKELRKVNEDKKALEKKVVKLEQLAFIKDQKIELYAVELKETHKQLSWERTKGNFKGIGGFLIGVAATSLAAYAASRVIK